MLYIPKCITLLIDLDFLLYKNDASFNSAINYTEIYIIRHIVMAYEKSNIFNYGDFGLFCLIGV